MSPDLTSFSQKLLHWFDHHGRHDLPWQHPRSLYRVWVSEVMLQQTQVTTVIPYFEKFMQRFPDVQALADAPQDEVLAHWAGLGYYARARNLHKAAQHIRDQHGGRFPEDFEQVMDLPGIGRSTAGAILSQALDQPHAILDGNVKRVLARFAAIEGWPGQPAVAERLWQVAKSLLPALRCADYTQAMMDLGATLCTRTKPRCQQCPLADGCAALAQGRVAELPASKPSKARPRRQVVMLVQLRGDEILLQKRPPSGIWGGLWSLPEVAPDEAPSGERWPVLVHQFSHFELEITPLLVKEQSVAGVMEADGQLWYKWRNLQEVGLPAPVRKILNQNLGEMP